MDANDARALADQVAFEAYVCPVCPPKPCTHRKALADRLFTAIEAARRLGDPLNVEVVAEVKRAETIHPETEGIPDGTGGVGYETWRNIAQHSCDRATREGRLTFAHILDEETAEALAETDKVKLRAELVQVEAVCRRWRKKLDREAGQ